MCENHVAKISCDTDNSVVHIINVKVGQLAHFDCGNGNGSLLSKNDRCQATGEEEDCLACAFMKSCDGKADCSIHVAHNTYLGFYLPCRNLRVNIPFEVLYDCTEGTVFRVDTLLSLNRLKLFSLLGLYTEAFGKHDPNHEM